MSDSTPAPVAAPAPAPDDPKKRLREKVDKLLASEPRKSESSIRLNGRTLKYTAVAQFIPVTASGVDDKRGEPEAAVFTTSYFLADAEPRSRARCASCSTAGRARRRSGCTWARSARSAW